MNLSEALKSGIGITMGEALGTGGVVTLTGMGIVFAVLIILMLLLMLFKVIFAPKKKAEPVQASAPAQAVPAAAEVKDDMDEAELIAVLTAAVAASLNTSTYNLQIKSYRRVDAKRPAWNKAGVRDTINSRF